MPIEPDDSEIIASAIDSRLLDLHTMVVAKVVSYDASKQAAVVVPVVNGAAPNSDGSTTSEPLPQIPNVPVRWERAGGYYDHKPLAAGDCGMLIFSESAFAHWRVTGELTDPGDLTRHAMSYPYFVPGCWPDAQALPDAPGSGEAVSIVPAGGHLRVSKAGSIAADFVALSAKVDMNFALLMAAFNAHTHLSTVPATPTALPVPLLTTFPGTAGTSLKSD